MTYALAAYAVAYLLAVAWGYRHVSDPGPMTDLVFGFCRLVAIVVGGGLLALLLVLGAIYLG